VQYGSALQLHYTLQNGLTLFDWYPKLRCQPMGHGVWLLLLRQQYAVVHWQPMMKLCLLLVAWFLGCETLLLVMNHAVH
jgi:hypothetical protein